MDSSISLNAEKNHARISVIEKISLDDPYDDLSPQEQEIMVLLAEGLSTKEIGERLVICQPNAICFWV